MIGGINWPPVDDAASTPPANFGWNPAFFISGIVMTPVLAVLLAFYGLDTDTAFSGALTAVTNVGPGVGTIIGPAGNFATLPEGAKWLLAFGMYVGRLELMTVFVLFTPAFWRAWA